MLGQNSYSDRCAVPALTLLLLLTASFSASADIEASQLVGTWEWVRTVPPWDGEVETPESAGYTQTLALHGDNTFTFYRDSSEVATGSWSLSDFQVCYSTPTLMVDHFYLGQPMDLQYREDYLGTGTDFLRFGLLCIDLSDYSFRRSTSVPIAASSWSTIKAHFSSSAQ